MTRGVLARRWAYLLALVPLLTDWVDTGHWPAHPRELATELVVGALILLGVHRLYRDAERYRELAERDPLTRLPNGRRFADDLAREVERARRASSPLTVAFVDVDRFKLVNDTHGHAEGDRVLTAVARLLEDVTRRSDRVYRVGGDEFVCVMPGSFPDFRDVLQRRCSDPAVFGRLAISLSVGVAQLQTGETADGLLARADAAMYTLKRESVRPVRRDGERLRAG